MEEAENPNKSRHKINTNKNELITTNHGCLG